MTPLSLLSLLLFALYTLHFALSTAEAAVWYVNDATYNASDTFTTAVGNNANAGSAAAPYLTITKALQSAGMGDTIYVDAGTFGETVVIDTNNITIVGRDSNATVIDPPGLNTTSGLYGIYADTQIGITIKSLGVTGAYNGILFDNVDNSTVSGDSAGACGNSGIYLRAGSDTNTISGNTANSNTIYGINLDASSNNTVSNNTANSNLSEGINLNASSNNTVSGNTANSNSGTGFYLTSSSNNTVSGNTASSNSFYGILLSTSSDNNTVTANTAGSNSQYGIFLSSSANNTVLQNTLNSNTQYQFYISGASSSDTAQKNNIKTSGTNPDSAVYNGSTTATSRFTFTRNWWGTTDEVKIKKMICQPSNGDSIIWGPYRLGQVDTLAGADTTAPAAPSTFSVTFSSPPGGPLTISWTNPTLNEETNGGAVGFSGVAIYRLVNLVDTTNWGNFANEVHVGTPTETTWVDTNVVGGITYYYRLTSHDSALFENESFFNDTNFYTVPAPAGPKTWFVNDTGMSGDSFTYSIGYDTAVGDSPNLPVRTIMKALSLAKAGDTIKIDAGVYAETVVIDTDNIALIGKDSVSTTIDPPAGDGIFADTQSGLTIKNLAVTGANVGIKLVSATRATITGDSVGLNSGVGILFLHNSDSNKITANHVANNLNGISLEGANVGNGVLSCDYNTIDKNYVAANTQYGISVIYDATHNTVLDNTTVDNTWDGILVHSFSQYNLITKNISKNNRNGINLLLGAVNYNMVSNNLFKSNQQAGVRLGGAGPDTNAIVQNAITNNDTGVWIVAGCFNNLFTKNNIFGNATNNVNNEPNIGQNFDRNWWGAIDEVTISAKFKDTASAFRPYRLSVVDTLPGADTTAPARPLNVTLDSSAPGQIKIQWTKPAINEDTNGGPVGLSSVIIFRLVNLVDTTNWGNSANEIGEVFIGGPTDTMFVDTNVVGGNTYYYRLISVDSALPFENKSFFTDTKFITADSGAGPPPHISKTWFVNDTSTAGDSFTYVIGYDTAAGDSPTTPFRTITKALQMAFSTDTILIDAGRYTETVVIDTNNIALIGKDSNASVIDPPGASGTVGLYGIYADTQNNITLKALGVTGAYNGIFFSNVSLSTITSDSSVSNGSYGIYLDNNSDTNTLTDNTVSWNSNEGIRIESSSNNTVSNNTVNSNTSNGIDVVNAASRNTVSGNTANGNAGIGIRIFGSGSDNKVTNNIAMSNTTYGIYLTSNTKNNIVRDNVVKNNAQTGLGISSSDTNAVYQNDIAGNDTGVLIAGSSRGNTIFKNNITGNTAKHLHNEGGLAQKTLTPNWWGTSNEDAISAKFSDTANTFRPYRLGVVDTALSVDTTAPGLVTGVTLDTTVAGQIKLTWTIPALNEETNGGAVGFNGANIWRLVNTPDTTHWSNTSIRVKSTISTETSWTDTNVANGSTYYYRITSKDSAASFNESFFTDTKWTLPTPVNAAGLLQVLFVGGGPAPDIAPGESMNVVIIDTGANTNTASSETVTVRIKNMATNEQETAILTELDTDDAEFKVQFRFSGNIADSAGGGGRLYVLAGDTVQFDYTDPGDANDTEQKILKVIPVLELKVLAAPDTQVKQGDTRAVLAFKIMNDNPIDNASPTDTVTGIQITRLLGADGHLVSNGVKLWFDTGAIGVFSETVDILDFSVSIGAGLATLTPNSARQVFAPGDTRHFIVTFSVADSSAIVGDSIDAKIAVGGVTHSLGGNVPDTDINSAGALAIIGSLPNVLIQAAQDITSTPAFYGGPTGDTVPGATLTYVIRYDNDGGETSVNFILNTKLPANTMLGRGADSPSAAALLSPHTGASATVTITDDSGNVVADTDPNAQRIKWTFSAGVAPNNGDANGVVDASAPDVDAGYVKYKVYIK